MHPLLQVPETLPADVLAKMHAPPKPDDPVADPHKLPEADAFFFGFPTRFGSPAAQFKAFWDATGAHWSSGALHSKPFSLFTSTATQNGGQEITLQNALSNFVHHGMIFVPPGYITPSTNFDLSEVRLGACWQWWPIPHRALKQHAQTSGAWCQPVPGATPRSLHLCLPCSTILTLPPPPSPCAQPHGGSPFGPGCLAGPDGSRQPSAKELDFAKAAGAHLAKTAKKLKA
jgi:multimeric flavodoxin WrbA